MKRFFKIWLEAIRLRTLPVSLSGVIIAIALAVWQKQFQAIPAMLCVAFAVLAQIVSNLANEYYDFKKGADKVGRVGPRRGVTEGDIKPSTLFAVTAVLTVIDCVIGLMLIPFGGLWLLPVGIVIALAAFAYSAGPYPLSYHAMGELAVFIFFGLVPVNFTYYVMAGQFNAWAMIASIAIGLMAVNVLLVNNYRDADDDQEAGKRTSVVVFGRRAAGIAYLFNGFIGIAMLSPLWVLIGWGDIFPLYTLLIPALYLVMHTLTWYKLITHSGVELNPLLGATARNMLIFTILLTIVLIAV